MPHENISDYNSYKSLKNTSETSNYKFNNYDSINNIKINDDFGRKQMNKYNYLEKSV